MSPRPPYVSAAPFMRSSLPQSRGAAAPPGRLRGNRGAWGAPGAPHVRDQPVLGNLDRSSEPHVLLVEHLLDQALEHAHARGPAHHLRMEHQVVEAALLVLAFELFRPDL